MATSNQWCVLSAYFSPEDNVFALPVLEQAIILHCRDQIITLDT